MLQVYWDDAAGVAFVLHPQGLLLETLEEVGIWRDEVHAKLEGIQQARAGRFPIVVCLDGVTIRPNVVAEYGIVVRGYAERFASGLARYSRRPNGVGQMVTVAAMKEGFKANLFTSRSEAIAHALLGHESSLKPRP
ncbi:MAG: hypothetical protein RL033_6953 [Pseudomonadota bacterium]|jgi:hypothetical protein